MTNFQIKLQEDQKIEQPVQQKNKKETMGSDAERGRFTLTYDAKPYKTVSMKGSIISARREEKVHHLMYQMIQQKKRMMKT